VGDRAVFINVKRDGKKTFTRDYLFRIKERKGGKEYYQCDKKCSIRVDVQGEFIIGVNGYHRDITIQGTNKKSKPCVA
jgi:hypothetical protein